MLFRGQNINDEHMLAMADALGGQQATGSRQYFLDAGMGTESGRVSALPGISIISNLDNEGKPVFKHQGSGSQELLWHTDNSYVDNPPAGSILHALQVPVNGGGHTSFANQYLAYERLPEATKEKIAGLHTKQDASRNTSGGVRPTKVMPSTYEEVEGPVHPIVRIHPHTGKRRSIWVAAMRRHPAIFWKCRMRKAKPCWTSFGKLQPNRTWFGPRRIGMRATY